MRRQSTSERHHEENIRLLSRKATVNTMQLGQGKIKINVSGLEYKTFASTLERFPGTFFSTSLWHDLISAQFMETNKKTRYLEIGVGGWNSMIPNQEWESSNNVST